MYGYLLPAERKRQFISAVLEPQAGLASDCPVPKNLDSVEMVVCIHIASLA